MFLDIKFQAKLKKFGKICNLKVWIQMQPQKGFNLIVKSPGYSIFKSFKKNDRFVWSSHSSSINIYKFILEKVWIHRLHLFLKCPICAFAIIVHWAYNRGDHYQMTILYNFLILQREYHATLIFIQEFFAYIIWNYVITVIFCLNWTNL